MENLKKVCEVCRGKFHGSFIEGEVVMYLCCKHLHHMTRYGRIIDRTRFDKNKIIKIGVKSEMFLYNKKNEVVAKTLIDSNLVEIVKNYKWAPVKKGESIYVKTDIRIGGKRGTLYLAHLILGDKKGFQIDHINGDTLDNRKENLRFVTQRQNLMNRAKALGYSQEKVSGLWHTYIGINNKRIQLGRFKTVEEAKKVRREAEVKYYGEFAKIEK
jgi:hypothetical protein